jgi:WD40 repeat protein
MGAEHDLRALAELAFGSLTRADEPVQGQHLALLHAESLELDLSDPAQRRIGDYELVELLGEGGMGAVYRGRQISLDRVVAVKLLSAGPWASRDFIARFEREARNAARMQHPNIVTVFEVGSRDGLHFFSMRLVEGHSLSTLLKRGERFAPKVAAEMLRTIAEAVAYAHSLGVLHLDLKPGNVLIDGNGTPHVADFGLARRFDSAAMVANDEISGTPSYMAPEQAQVRSSRLTAATDVWGMGAILYELLTGTPPFRAETAQATLKLPLDLEAIVLRCLARNPDGRYPSARALADDLARYLEGRPVQARPLNAMQRVMRWAKREPRLAATALLAFGALVVGLIATSRQWQRADVNAQLAQANARTASVRLWDSRGATALRYMESADGWKAAPLLLANLAEMEAQGDDARARKERKQLGIIENANPQLIDVLPAPLRTNVLAFSPDGSRLAINPEDRVDLRLIDLASGRQLWRNDGRDIPGGGIPPNHVEFGHGGDSIFTSYSAFTTPSTPFPLLLRSRFDARSGQWLLPLDRPLASDDGVGYSADGRYALLFLSGGRTGMQLWRVDPWQAISPPRKLPESAPGALVAPDAESFVVPTMDYHIELYAGETMERVWRFKPDGFQWLTAWAYSPDSHWLALGDLMGGVWVADVRTHEIRKLMARPVTRIHELRFSDDGTWLAAASGAGGVYVWSWPDGQLVVPPFGMELQPERVRLDRMHSRVMVSGTQGSAGLWEIPETQIAWDRSDAVPLGGRFATPATARGSALVVGGGDGVAWHPSQGLLAHSATGRRVQVERFRPSVLKRAPAAPIKPSTLHFDGRRLATVVGHQVRIVDAQSEAPSRAPFEFPQPPGFAALTADGRTLVVTAGRMLHAYDVGSGKPRFAPVALVNSPQHVELNPDGGSVAIGWIEHDPARGVVEAVEVRSLRSGARMAGPIRFQGAAEALCFDAAGARLLAWNFAHLTLRDGHTLAAISGPLADLHTAPHQMLDEGATREVAFGPDGDVWLSLTREMQDRSIHELRHYLRDGALHTVTMASAIERIVPLPDGSLAVVPEGGGLALWLPGDKLRELPDVQRDTVRSEAAVSADGRWLARAQTNGVVLFDAQERTRIATLRAPLPGRDLIFQLAFSPDGNHLLARSLRNRLIVWDLAPDRRPVDQIARELALRDIALPDEFNPTTALSESERAALRANDPGAPFIPDMPDPPSVRVLPGGPIAPRDSATPADALDLTALYNLGLPEFSRPAMATPGDFAWVPRGVQRWLGVDYDIRGGLKLQGKEGYRDANWKTQLRPVQIASSRPDVAAVDILLVDYNASGHDRDRLLRVTWRYADDSRAIQWIPVGDQVQPSHTISQWGKRTRLATFGYDARSYSVLTRPVHAYAPRLANPHPERPLRGFTFAAPQPGVSAVILGITVEPNPSPDRQNEARRWPSSNVPSACCAR